MLHPGIPKLQSGTAALRNWICEEVEIRKSEISADRKLQKIDVSAKFMHVKQACDVKS